MFNTGSWFKHCKYISFKLQKNGNLQYQKNTQGTREIGRCWGCRAAQTNIKVQTNKKAISHTFWICDNDYMCQQNHSNAMAVYDQSHSELCSHELLVGINGFQRIRIVFSYDNFCALLNWIRNIFKRRIVVISFILILFLLPSISNV